MSWVVERLRLGPAPALVVHPGASPRGCVLYLHGLSASKEAHPPELELLARQGFVAAAIDAPHHGERRTGRLEELERLAPDQREAAFPGIVEEAADELPVLLTEAAERFSVPLAAMGVMGISFGGFTAYASALRHPRPAALVAVIASPEWKVHHSRRIAPAALRKGHDPAVSLGHDTRVANRGACRAHDFQTALPGRAVGANRPNLTERFARTSPTSLPGRAV